MRLDHKCCFSVVVSSSSMVSRCERVILGAGFETDLGAAGLLKPPCACKGFAGENGDGTENISLMSHQQNVAVAESTAQKWCNMNVVAVLQCNFK